MSRRASLMATLCRLEETVLRGVAESSVDVREAAARGEGEGPLGEYAKTVQTAAYRVSEDRVRSLQASHSDDLLFEVTVAAALGAARKRLEVGLTALDAAFEDAS
jgi:hypothetical protein